ncbi:hypothetical protein H9N25_16790 [Pedobacter riviphilus]|uniref:Bacteriophage abortive infection AbiH n=1 Tax=Pedobacter riviphilus TaxID=2766984 RepID=A0ABX6TK43_9SPHI|nr:AbiH family protein [Pedobacter riviphilus]QNR83595.1 hypothetical protein H9N25_16790 [Pedobacter riviphilus]
MNRLIIIGNGFDLAHGLKTSYCDFINNYLTNALNIFAESRFYDDPLLEITHINKHRYYTNIYPVPVTIESVYYSLSQLGPSTNTRVKYKSAILAHSINNTKFGKWVDLENEYFDQLKSLTSNAKQNGDYSSILTLNDQLNFIKLKLHEYLSMIELDLEHFEPSKEIFDLFHEQIDSDDIVLELSSTDISKTLFLNFNYTNTVEKYRGNRNYGASVSNKRVKIPDDINYIHGSLNTPGNPIIFGYGDEYDDDYLLFEKHKQNHLFTHIKSFSYFKTVNYHSLIRFLENDDYQVFIVGHSCGLSDRTMLKEIFEHSKCKSIKIFYYKRQDGSTDFTEKTYDLARHFTSKGEMRKKIVSEPNSKPFPQYTNPSAKK